MYIFQSHIWVYGTKRAGMIRRNEKDLEGLCTVITGAALFLVQQLENATMGSSRMVRLASADIARHI